MTKLSLSLLCAQLEHALAECPRARELRIVPELSDSLSVDESGAPLLVAQCSSIDRALPGVPQAQVFTLRITWLLSTPALTEGVSKHRISHDIREALVKLCKTVLHGGMLEDASGFSLYSIEAFPLGWSFAVEGEYIVQTLPMTWTVSLMAPHRGQD